MSSAKWRPFCSGGDYLMKTTIEESLLLHENMIYKEAYLFLTILFHHMYNDEWTQHHHPMMCLQSNVT